MTKLSNTTIALLRMVKGPEDNTQEKIREVLGEIYHPEMTINDIRRVVFQSYMECLQIYPMEMPYRGSIVDALQRISEAPIHLFVLAEKRDVVQSYEASMQDALWLEIRYMLSQLLCTRIDWCREQLFPESEQLLSRDQEMSFIGMSMEQSITKMGT